MRSVLEISEQHPVVLFDGLCGFCDRSVRLLLSLDREKKLRFLPLQDPRAREFTDGNLSSIVVVIRGQRYQEGAALLKLSEEIPGLRFLRAFPVSVLNVGYRAIAQNRNRFWKRFSACRLPSPEERQVFL